ncbi:hypothetical protein A5882_003672 [Enterococcus sp. 4E1_DIV0656]|uniref:AI-2E family transporter n=1 Tax=Enterococcus sp. 4E1_DIV0656 TaxID=1834180 RepID=UPI000B62B470|nr:AI-2E family transporter [Enterococcus sp. 4E1_DIV0656]OTO08993.1 hypothetical protein A5882_003672 [Enterococcus sp. 4E1_DIV0656]
MDYLKKSKYFYVIVLVFLSLLTWSEIRSSNFMFRLFEVVLSTLLLPFIIAIFLYYMLRPVYLYILKKLNREIYALIGTFFLFFFVFFLIVKEFLPVLFLQTNTILKEFPLWIDAFDQWLVQSDWFGENTIQDYLSLINTSLEDVFGLAVQGLQNGLILIIGILANSVIVISIVPIMVLFMLKQTNKPKSISSWVPNSYVAILKDFIRDIEKALSDYIGGKSVVCLYVFVGAWITFAVAGLEGALVFAVIAGLMDIVPYFGPWIGTLPAILSAIVSDQVNIVVIILGILLVQIGESYIVSPYVMSKELKMHPLSVIITLLITGQIFGIVGMVIILPLLASLKVVYIYSIKIYQKSNIDKNVILKERENEK